MNKKKDKKLTFLSRTERNELKRLSAELPTITQDAADRDRQLQEHRATKQALFEQKTSIDTRRIHLNGVFSELDGQRSKIEDIQSKLDVAQGVVSSADNLRDQISALETEANEQRVLRGNYRDSYRSKQQEIFTRLDEARRIVDRAISNPTHRAERDAAQAHINVHGLTQGSIAPGDLTVKQQEQALSLLRIKIGALNDFLKGGSGAQEAAKGAGASSVEAATQQRVVLASLERQLLTELQATRIDQFFKARENVKVLSAAAREDVSAAEKEHRARAFYEAKDTLVDQRAQFHPVMGQGQITGSTPSSRTVLNRLYTASPV